MLLAQETPPGAVSPEDVKRFKEAVLLMGTGVLLGIVGIRLFTKVEGFKYFIVSVGGVLAGRGLIRFFS